MGRLLYYVYKQFNFYNLKLVFISKNIFRMAISFNAKDILDI